MFFKTQMANNISLVDDGESDDKRDIKVRVVFEVLRVSLYFLF